MKPPAGGRRRFWKPRVIRVLGLVAALCAACLGSGCDQGRAPAYAIRRDDGRNPEAMAAAQGALARLYPPRYRATQRAIITVGRRQFVCDGVLAVSPQAGEHLAVVSTLGLVTEVQVATNGQTRLLRASPLLKETWSRDFVARDLRELFAPCAEGEPGGWLADGRLVLESRPRPDGSAARWVFTPSGQRLQEIEVVRGQRRLYLARIRQYRQFAGFPRGIPAEFDVRAPAYRLELRTAALTVLSGDAPGIAGAAPP